MSNLLIAISNILKLNSFELENQQNFSNRANALGDSLENFILDIFCDTVIETDVNKKLAKRQEIFSYIGNSANPPDFMLKNGDAIEVKKIENFNSALALNSNYPKDKLYANSHMITKYCKECEEWDQKDIVYVVGVVEGSVLKSLSFVYGEDYAANFEIYERIKNAIKNGVEIIPNIEFSKTKELGRVNKVDPLGITYLRIRGMWHIENPLKTFNYIFQRDTSKNFSLMCVINENKFNTFQNRSEFINLINQTKGSNIDNVLIKNPNNPAILKNAKLITYEV